MRSVVGPSIKGILFSVVTLLATIALGITIANTGVGRTVDYSATFRDVTSLNPGDEVRMAGVRIGQVDSVAVAEHRLAEVRFSVNAGRSISAHATIAVRYRNLIGQRYLSVTQGPPGDTATLSPGANIPVERTAPALDLTALFDGFKPLFQALSPNDVNKLAFEVIQVLQGEGSTVESLLSHTASLTGTLAGRDRVIGEVIDNLNSVLDTVNAKGDQLASLVDTTERLVRGLAAQAGPVGAAIAGLGELSTSTAGLLADGRAPLKASITNLGGLAKNLADNTPAFQSFLNNLATKFDRIGATGSYGSWLNFYLCAAHTDAATPPGGAPPGVPLTQGRCR